MFGKNRYMWVPVDFQGLIQVWYALKLRLHVLLVWGKESFMLCAHFRLGSNATRTHSKAVMNSKHTIERLTEHSGALRVPPKQQHQPTDRWLKAESCFKKQLAKPPFPVTESPHFHRWLKLFLTWIKAPLAYIHSKWASKCPARKAKLKIPYETILLDSQWPVNLPNVKTLLNKQDSITQNHLSRCDKLHKNQEITSIKICVQVAFSLLSTIRVRYNIQLPPPTEKYC